MQNKANVKIGDMGGGSSGRADPLKMCPRGSKVKTKPNKRDFNGPAGQHGLYYLRMVEQIGRGLSHVRWTSAVGREWLALDGVTFAGIMVNPAVSDGRSVGARFAGNRTYIQGAST